MSSEVMLSLEGISKTFIAAEVETTALNNINFTVRKGEFVAVMGPSGCGKSTLLNILGLLDELDTGQYFLLGTDITHHNEHQLAALRREKMGFVFQDFNLLEELNVYDNIELPLLYQKMSLEKRKRRVSESMEKVDIAHRAKHRPSQLSGGQQQRVAVARAIVGQPELIFADEPTGNLDSSNGNQVMSLLSTLNTQGSTIVMVTHSPSHGGYAQRIVSMLDGQIEGENTVTMRKEAQSV